MPGTYFHLLPGAGADAIARASSGAPSVKVCDAGAIAIARRAGARFVYYRPYLAGADDGDCGDGAAWAGDVWADLAANGGIQPDAIGFRNECQATVQTGAQYLRYRDALLRFGYRGKVVLGSFSTGTPDWPQWADLRAGLAGYAPDALELHEYWDLSVSGSAPWWALRHAEAIRRGLLPAAWPLFIGECGSDGIQQRVNGQLVPVEDAQGRRGWQDRGKLTSDQQRANLRAYIAGCAPSVRACFVFADGTDDPHWLSYRTFGTPLDAAIRQTWTSQAVQGIGRPAADSSSNDSTLQAHNQTTTPKPQTSTVAKGTPAVDWPLINQLAQPDDNDANDCGPATADMIAGYLGIVPVGDPVRQVKLEETGDADWQGYTSTTQMQAWFANRGVPCVQVQTRQPSAAIADALGKGWPVAYLRYWDLAARTGGHFVACVPGQPLYTLGNPWGGVYDTWTADQIDQNSLGGWLVIVQQAKEMTTVDDSLKAAAVERFSALGVQPNTAGALFAAYARMVDRWLKSGRDALADPTPAIRPEANSGEDAYLALDSGLILHWRKSDGLVYQAEDKERAAIFAGCGWTA